MDDGSSGQGWAGELERWLEPFLARLRRQAQRRWAPVYLKGLILPGERKSVEPMAARVAPADTQQLHHFVSTSPWATAPLEDELVRAADRLVGGPDAALVVDDTALVKQGRHSVGVKRQSRTSGSTCAGTSSAMASGKGTTPSSRPAARRGTGSWRRPTGSAPTPPAPGRQGGGH